MAFTLFKKWLKDKEGKLIAPYTLASSVLTSKGDNLEDVGVKLNIQGTTIGTSNPVNADTLGGSVTGEMVQEINTKVNNHETSINDHTTSINNNSININKNTESINGLTQTLADISTKKNITDKFTVTDSKINLKAMQYGRIVYLAVNCGTFALAPNEWVTVATIANGYAPELSTVTEITNYYNNAFIRVDSSGVKMRNVSSASAQYCQCMVMYLI